MIDFIKNYLSEKAISYPVAIISLLGGIVTIACGIIAIHSAIFESPQEKLTKMGIQWSADNFLDNVRIGNINPVVNCRTLFEA